MHYVKKRRLICQIDFDCKKPNAYGLGQILLRGILGDVRKSNGGGVIPFLRLLHFYVTIFRTTPLPPAPSCVHLWPNVTFDKWKQLWQMFLLSMYATYMKILNYCKPLIRLMTMLNNQKTWSISGQRKRHGQRESKKLCS
jgi:hypothetical protein